MPLFKGHLRHSKEAVAWFISSKRCIQQCHKYKHYLNALKSKINQDKLIKTGKRLYEKWYLCLLLVRFLLSCILAEKKCSQQKSVMLSQSFSEGEGAERRGAKGGNEGHL